MGGHEPVRPATVNAPRVVRSAAAQLAGSPVRADARWRRGSVAWRWSRPVCWLFAQFASGGKSEVANAAQEAAPRRRRPPTPTTAPAAPDDSTVDRARRQPGPDDDADLDGKIVIQIGDGDPIVIDLGDLGSARWPGGGSGDLGDLGKIEQCIGDLPFTRPRHPIRRARGLDVFGDGDDDHGHRARTACRCSTSATATVR